MSGAILTAENEEWRDVAGFVGYQVSNLGRMRSRRHRSGLQPGWHVLKPGIGIGRHKGHRYMLYGKSGKQYLTVANLVLEAFVGARPEGLWGLHKDDDQYHNKLSNLYWGTPKDNAADCTRNGRRYENKGSKHGLAKLTEPQVSWIRRLHGRGISQKMLARIFQVNRSTIFVIIRRKGWKHVA